MLFLTLFVGSASFGSLALFSWDVTNGFLFASAEEDEESEEESEDDRQSSDDDEEEASVTEETRTITVMERVPVQVIVTAAGYDTDTDSDQLVDALDPDPKVPQWEYFTDTDGDSIPDVSDKYPGEDDFAYLDFFDGDLDGLVDTGQ